ncbi:MAG: PhzF family phenazine biosynthesis protein [Prolixibacteraceae bacterium]|nr:PhzF family phenazine biosynthesis protein [Prolixibacteraceae bacterium]
MQLTLYQIDAFTDTLFRGNPAAVIILEKWIDEKLMQNIAAENNLSETAFVCKDGEKYAIRYFTPLIEVPLCGHATLASAFVLFNITKDAAEKIVFETYHSEKLYIKHVGKYIELDFPVDQFVPCDVPPQVKEMLGISPVKAYRGTENYMLICENEKQITGATPDFDKLKQLGTPVMITASGDDVDFVSRFFAPNEGINEDPVTGSAHRTLIPYWSKRLNKITMNAKQLSKRGGDLQCEYADERVRILGQAVHYLTGTVCV